MHAEKVLHKILENACAWMHLQYQANSIRKRHVLSVIYLGLRIAYDQRFRFDLDELPAVAVSLHANIQKHAEEC